MTTWLEDFVWTLRLMRWPVASTFALGVLAATT